MCRRGREGVFACSLQVTNTNVQGRCSLHQAKEASACASDAVSVAHAVGAWVLAPVHDQAVCTACTVHRDPPRLARAIPRPRRIPFEIE